MDNDRIIGSAKQAKSLVRDAGRAVVARLAVGGAFCAGLPHGLTRLVAVFLLLVGACASTAASAAESPADKAGPACGKCETIAGDYGKAWDALSKLFAEEADLEKTIGAINQDFQKAYFSGSETELQTWSKTTVAAIGRLTELPTKIAEARKEVDTERNDLAECIQQKCFSAREPTPPSSAGNQETCKACAENANRVADLTARLVRLNAIAAELEAAMPTREASLKEAEAAHEKDMNSPPLVVAQKGREVLAFLQNQEDTLQDAIKALDSELDTAQHDLETCRSVQCPAKGVAAVTPSARPPAPTCAKCEGLFKQLAADEEEIVRLTSVRATFEKVQSDLKAKEDQGALKEQDKLFLDAATSRLEEIDSDLKRLSAETDKLNVALERCKNEPCTDAEKVKPAAKVEPPAANEPIKNAIEKLKKLGTTSKKK